jgi:hypothetical protein
MRGTVAVRSCFTAPNHVFATCASRFPGRELSACSAATTARLEGSAALGAPARLHCSIYSQIEQASTSSTATGTDSVHTSGLFPRVSRGQSAPVEPSALLKSLVAQRSSAGVGEAPPPTAMVQQGTPSFT